MPPTDVINNVVRQPAGLAGSALLVLLGAPVQAAALPILPAGQNYSSFPVYVNQPSLARSNSILFAQPGVAQQSFQVGLDTDTWFKDPVVRPINSNDGAQLILNGAPVVVANNLPMPLLANKLAAYVPPLLPPQLSLNTSGLLLQYSFPLPVVPTGPPPDTHDPGPGHYPQTQVVRESHLRNLINQAKGRKKKVEEEIAEVAADDTDSIIAAYLEQESQQLAQVIAAAEALIADIVSNS